MKRYTLITSILEIYRLTQGLIGNPPYNVLAFPKISQAASMTDYRQLQAWTSNADRKWFLTKKSDNQLELIQADLIKVLDNDLRTPYRLIEAIKLASDPFKKLIKQLRNHAWSLKSKVTNQFPAHDMWQVIMQQWESDLNKSLNMMVRSEINAHYSFCMYGHS